MLRSVLVPLDGSPFSEHALPWARVLCRKTGAALHLAHVHVPRPREELITFTQFQYEGVSLAEYDWRDRKEEGHYLDVVAERMQAQEDFPVEAAVLSGSVAESLRCQADEVAADLVVMTTHGRTGASRAWVGSVADKLVRSSDRPLLMVRESTEDGEARAQAALERILVPLDGSKRSEGILGTAGSLARTMDGRLVLLTVVSARVVVGAREYPVPRGHLEERADTAREYLRDVAQGLRARDTAVEIRVEGGAAPAPAILEAVEHTDAGVVAMATHGYSGMARTVLGSVADKVLRGARVPLLLRRPEA